MSNSRKMRIETFTYLEIHKFAVFVLLSQSFQRHLLAALVETTRNGQEFIHNSIKFRKSRRSSGRNNR